MLEKQTLHRHPFLYLPSCNMMELLDRSRNLRLTTDFATLTLTDYKLLELTAFSCKSLQLIRHQLPHPSSECYSAHCVQQKVYAEVCVE